MASSAAQIEVSGAAFVPICPKAHGSTPRCEVGPPFNPLLPKKFRAARKAAGRPVRGSSKSEGGRRIPPLPESKDGGSASLKSALRATSFCHESFLRQIQPCASELRSGESG